MKVVKPFFEELDKGDFEGVTSTLTLLEVLVQPFRQGDLVLAEKYRDILLATKGIMIVPLSDIIVEEAAKLRGKYKIRIPDAVQHATTIHEGADTFLTNDHRLKVIQEIEVIVLDDLLKG